jgi:hypothetical protein
MPRFLLLTIELADTAPVISRTILIPETATFLDLHEAIQDAAGWQDYHLWRFDDLDEKGRRGKPVAVHEMEADDGPMAKSVTLGKVFTKTDKLVLYTYDFGDGWEHVVALDEIRTMDETFTRRLVAGERSFPPEDCGGIPGYEMCLLALGRIEYEGPADYKPSDEELAERREWLGDWDPDGFDLAAVAREFDA